MSWRALVRAKADGEVVRAGRAYCLRSSSRDAQLARQLDGVRSHVTAAAYWGLALPPLDDVRRTQHDITIPRKAQRTRCPDEARLHYRDYPAGDVVGDVTTVLTTVIDALRDESLLVAVCVGDSALHKGLVSKAALVERARELRGPGSALVRERVELLDERAENAFESATRVILIRAGITGFEPQVAIRHRRQWIGRVDLANRVLRIVIESDGFETHGDRAAFVRDRVRMTCLVSAGWRPLQLTWEQVMFRQDWVLERILDTIAVAQAGAPIAAQQPRGRARRAA